jgi:hypothetical protein
MNANNEAATPGSHNQRRSTNSPIDRTWQQDNMEDTEDVSPIMSPIVPSADGFHGTFSHPLSGPNDVHSIQLVDRNGSNSVLLNPEFIPQRTVNTNTKRSRYSWYRWFCWNVGTRRILSICFLVTIPMVAFTTTILWLIFGNMTGAAVCPYPELCPDLHANNGTDPRDNYYVDFPTAPLVFITSWSSSLGFPFVAALMSMYSYITAAQFQRMSELDQTRKRLPTPYQMTSLLRVLNAELMALFDLVTLKLKEVFWDRQSNQDTREKSPLLRASIIVFVSGIFARYAVE